MSPAQTSARSLEEIAQLKLDMLEMAQLARSMIHDGYAALAANDRFLARGVQQQASDLAGHDEALESRALDLVASSRLAPADVRRVAAILKLLTYLNRVGRYGLDIARAVDGATDLPPIAGLVQLSAMVQRVESMLELVLQAVAQGTTPDLEGLLDLEDLVDESHGRHFETMLAHAAKDPSQLRGAAQSILVARALERAADNVCKMGEKVHYAATGERVILR